MAVLVGAWDLWPRKVEAEAVEVVEARSFAPVAITSERIDRKSVV